MVKATGGVCQQQTARSYLSPVESEQTHARKIFQILWASQEVCPKHRNIRREITSGCDANGVAMVFVLFCPEAIRGCRIPFRPGGPAMDISGRPRRGGYSAFRPGCTRSGKAPGRAWMKYSAPPLCSHHSIAGCLSANQGMPVRIRLTAPIFKKHTKCAAVADKECSGLQTRPMWERYPPAVPFLCPISKGC